MYLCMQNTEEIIAKYAVANNPKAVNPKASNPGAQPSTKKEIYIFFVQCFFQKYSNLHER